MKNIFGIITLVILVAFALQLQSIVIDSSTINIDTVSQLGNQNIVEIAESNPDLSTFLQAVNASGLNIALEGTGPFTVFAPSNEAFAALPPNELQELMKKENKSRLAALLKNHIIKGSLQTNAMSTSNVTSMGGKPLHIEVRGSQATVNGAGIVQPDLAGSNGVVQIIDTVLFVN